METVSKEVKQRRKESKQRSWDKKYEASPYIVCECGCGEKTKSVDRYGRAKRFIKNHRPRKYEDPKQYKREWVKRNREQIRERRQIAKSKRSKVLKIKLIQYKGNKCIQCGLEYNGKNAVGFDFHHINPEEKSFGVGFAMQNRSWERTLEEVDKCVLMCRVCHSVEHYGEY